MKRIFALTFFLYISVFAQEGKISFAMKNPENIQVLLHKDVSGAVIEVKGPYYIFNPEDGSKISSGLLGKRFRLHALADGIKWGEFFPGIHQMYITPRSPTSSILVDGIQYEGAIAIFQTGKNINIVNDLSVENYLHCVLSPLFSYPLENEVMASIAILARTDAYYQIAKTASPFWDVDAKHTNYQGCALVNEGSILSKCIESTKDLILVYPHEGKNEPFPAKWTDHSAGITAPYSVIFRKDSKAPNFSVKAPHAEIDKEETKWSFSILKNELASTLGLQSIEKIELFIDKDSKKTYGLRVFEKNQKHDYDFLEFQSLIGISKIQSSEFTLTQAKEKFTFTGYGYGHGVGLCIFSASALAENGENAVQILTKFFPNTALMNLSNLTNRHEDIAEKNHEINIFNL